MVPTDPPKKEIEPRHERGFVVSEQAVPKPRIQFERTLPSRPLTVVTSQEIGVILLR
jgi:hypothetical protein